MDGVTTQSVRDDHLRLWLPHWADDETDDSLVRYIASCIAQDIVEGNLQPGEFLNSVKLAERFGTSRTPVREALLRLEREGVVETIRRRRSRVSRMTIAEVRCDYELRAGLNGLVAELVCARARDDQIAALWNYQHQLDRAAEANDVAGYFWKNVEFRNGEADLTGNPPLRRTLDQLGLRTLRLRHLSLSYPGRLAVSCDEHRRLLRAYEQRDTALAVALNRSITMAGLRTIEDRGWTGLRGEDVLEGSGMKEFDTATVQPPR
ncbi:GntR family transcriptional regulator [Rhodococcus wratislaviensis]|uniref:Putative GntR family transcriptional regulator n=1 Tax=Rhodococcus wratislaviensis NBRC 100605 TaxID=1219028 RepID=X0PTS0_RHOWR|nr:GntR family transcriptional regulator [Rhodococcus wratislaviensis]GAF46453.1 putative GntR family transcriptional regulator [Rhodococcus wratislaviensis NBRC 100605]